MVLENWQLWQTYRLHCTELQDTERMLRSWASREVVVLPRLINQSRKQHHECIITYCTMLLNCPLERSWNWTVTKMIRALSRFDATCHASCLVTQGLRCLQMAVILVLSWLSIILKVEKYAWQFINVQRELSARNVGDGSWKLKQAFQLNHKAIYF